VFLELLLSVVDVLISFILQVNSLLCLLISFSCSFGLFNHSVNCFVRETSTTLDLDTLLLTGGLVLGRDIHDAVSINVKGDFDLWVTTRSHWDALKFEISELLVILGKLTFSLKDTDADLGLIVSRCGEDLTLLGRDCRVTSDQLGADSSHRLDTER